MKTPSNTHEISADIRLAIVRSLGAALAAAWRARYAQIDESPARGGKSAEPGTADAATEAARKECIKLGTEAARP